MHILFQIVLSLAAGLLAYTAYLLGIAPRFNPLQVLAGPPARSWFKTHLKGVLEYVDLKNHTPLVDFLFRSPVVSPRVHEIYVQRYGRSIRIQGIGAVRYNFLLFCPSF